MSDPLETLVRQAQDARAGAAADGDLDRIRRALPVLARRRRHRRRAAFAAAAVVACALLATGAGYALPLAAPDRPAAPAPTPTNPPPSPAHGPGLADAVVGLPYDLPTPPPGLHERRRAVDDAPTGRTMTRVYTEAADADRALAFIVRPAAVLPAGQPLVIGPSRAPGVYDQAHDTLVWKAPTGQQLVLECRGVVLTREKLVALAASVTPDPTPFVVPLRLGWVPGAHPILRYSLGGATAHQWTATAIADGQAEHAGTLMATVGPNAGGGTGTVIALHAQPAYLLEDTDPATGHARQTIRQSGWSLGLTLTVTYVAPDDHPLSRADLIAAAEAVELPDDVDTDWLDT